MHCWRIVWAHKLAKRWASLAPLPLAGGAGGGVGDARRASPPPTPPASGRGEDVAIAIALAFPDRIARRRDASGETWASVGGRGFRLNPASALARNDWLAVAETQGMASGARILSAAAIDLTTVEGLFGDRIETRHTVTFDPVTGGVQAMRERRLGAIRLASGPDAAADPASIAAALLDGVRANGLDMLPWSDAATALRHRAAFAAAHGGADLELDDAALLARADEWLAPLLEGKRRLSSIDPGALTDALRGIVGWDAMRAIDWLAPTHFNSPAGSSHPIDYAAEGGPRVDLRPQQLFGLAVHPAIGGGRIPLVLSLTSPAGRPIQTTRDLPGFWVGSWADVAREMRGRYPRHPWPDDPAAATATMRTKNADARARQPR